MVVRCREAGDEIRLSGGTKSLKKLFVDRKIPAWKRLQIPVLTDEKGILGVYTIGADVSRKAESLSAVTVRFESAEK
jgi:tRNA(Ile)-lysidine synthase